jgi:hypothetical protein
MPKSKRPRSEMTQEEIAKLDKLAADKRKLRAAKAIEKVANRSSTEIRASIKTLWEKNLSRLSPADRKMVEDHRERHEYICLAMMLDCRRMRDNAPYGAAEKESDTLFFPERLLFEVEDFARRFPPTKSLESYYTFFQNLADRNLSDEPYYFREFGYPVDSIDHVGYYEFLYCFRDWYRKNRKTLTLSTEDEFGEPEYVKTWEQVDELMLQISRLACLVGVMQRPDPEPLPEVVSAPASALVQTPRTELPAPSPEPANGWIVSRAVNWPRSG